MKKRVKAYTLYTRGLGEGSLSMLASCYGAEAEMLDLEKGFPRQEKNKHSGVIWITMKAWVDLTSDERSKISDMPKILVLPSNAEISHLNDFGSLGFTAILVEPLQGQKVREAMTNALETSNIQQDIHRMAREIMLERDLLERKNSNLDFLLNFLSSTSGLLLPEELLKVAKETLVDLLPINNLGLFVWLHEEASAQEESFPPCMFIPAEKGSAGAGKWEQDLIDAALSMGWHEDKNYEILPLESGFSSLKSSKGKNLSIALPLRIKGQPIGVAIINLAEDFPLGRETLEVLESSMAHLALAIRAAWLHRQVKNQSERDGLTGLYNRRYLDRIIQRELGRHERYRHELGLIMLDIDHFKSVNDDFGHLYGDEVLKDVGKILTEELRYSDCIARYGGEEFAILLPYTGDDQAWMLAERLRLKIENHSFCDGKLGRKVTASFGITSFRAGLNINACQLINQADIALYRAKQQGRNCSVVEPIVTSLEVSRTKVHNLNA